MCACLCELPGQVAAGSHEKEQVEAHHLEPELELEAPLAISSSSLLGVRVWLQRFESVVLVVASSSGDLAGGQNEEC